MLSAIIPAHNEERLIGGTLDALRAACEAVQDQFAMPYEIIVADDASDDGTVGIARARGARIVGVDHRRISAVRNAGARVAEGEHLVFVDADTLVPPETLVAAIAALRAGAVGGGAYIRFDRPIPTYARAMEPVAALIYRVVGLASGCFTFCEREVFEAVGGYDEALAGGEEAALSTALKKHGKLVVLREEVLTSGRKLRTYSSGEILRVLTTLALRPRRGAKDTALWGILYDERRPDPETRRVAD